MSKERCEQLIEAGRTQRAALLTKIGVARADFDAADTIYTLALKQAEQAGQTLEIAGKDRDEKRVAEEILQKREATIGLALGDLQDAVLEYGAAELLGKAANEADQQDAREILARAAEYESLAATVIGPPEAQPASVPAFTPAPEPTPAPVPVVPPLEAAPPDPPAEMPPPLPDVPPLPEPAPAAPAPVPPADPPVS